MELCGFEGQQQVLGDKQTVTPRAGFTPNTLGPCLEPTRSLET